jgi:chromosome segregation ATPase
MENGLYEMRISNLEANMKVLETKIQQLFEASKPVQESMVVSQVNLHTDMLSDVRRDLILLKNGLEWCEEHIKNLEGNATADSAEAFKEYDRLKAEYNKCQEDLKKINDQLFNQAQENIGLCMDKQQLEEKLNDVESTNLKLSIENQQLKDNNYILEQRAHKDEVEIHSLKDEIADKDKAIEILKKRINTLGEEKALLCQRKDKKIETLTKERDRLRELYFESIVKEETSND